MGGGGPKRAFAYLSSYTRGVRKNTNSFLSGPLIKKKGGVHLRMYIPIARIATCLTTKGFISPTSGGAPMTITPEDLRDISLAFIRGSGVMDIYSFTD